MSTSSVTMAPHTTLCEGASEGGGISPNLLFEYRKSVQLGSKMFHLSPILAFGRREIIFWVQKALSRGRQRKTIFIVKQYLNLIA